MTEILITGGVQLVGNLPAAFELATVDAAGICSAGMRTASARDLARLLSGDAHAEMRRDSGFLPL